MIHIDSRQRRSILRLIKNLIFKVLEITSKNNATELNVKTMRKILVIRLDEIGDVVITSAFLRELRKNAPNAHISLMVRTNCYNIIELCPFVDRVLQYKYTESNNIWGNFLKIFRAAYFALRELRGEKYEVAILPRWDIDWYLATLVAYLSGVKLRVGYSEKVNSLKSEVKEGFDILLTHAIYDKTHGHEVEKTLNLISYCGGYISDNKLELWLGTDDLEYADKMLESHSVQSNDSLIVFVPCARELQRNWPWDNYREIAHWLYSKYKVRIIILGGRETIETGDKLSKSLGKVIINLAGLTTLRQSAALLKRSQLYIGSDTGPMHMASAMGIPIVEISCHPKSGENDHFNSPTRFGPWQVPNVILQPSYSLPGCQNGCEKNIPHCITSVTTRQAKQAISDLIDKHR